MRPMKTNLYEFLLRTCPGIALAAIASVPATSSAVVFDLSPLGSQELSVAGDVGGTAIFADFFTQPTGTGVFEPFLTLDSNGKTSTGNTNIESAYNTAGTIALYLDQHRPAWNTLLRVSDLATITRGNTDYFGFILDANEPGGDKDLISIDNIRIYTSAVDNTALVKSDITKLNLLGDLRWAMNDGLQSGGTPNLDGFNVDTWIKLDASQENVDQGNSNGGSGKGDMVVYIPQAAFGNSRGTQDYVWFYNLNGVHYSADKNLAAQAGFEEWRAIKGPPRVRVPDGGSTLALLGLSVGGFGFLRRHLKSSKA